MTRNRKLLLTPFQLWDSNENDVNNLNFILPKEEVLRKYRMIVEKSYERIARACFESRALAELRDALLPKLMSGELDVDDVEV